MKARCKRLRVFFLIQSFYLVVLFVGRGFPMFTTTQSQGMPKAS